MKINPKPFKRVEKVVIEISDLFGEFAHINDIFPSLRHLVLTCITISKDFTGAISIPHLERLDIYLIRHFNFDLKNTTDVIKANRQLRSLHIATDEYEEIKLATISDMISENTSISELNIRQDFTSVSTDELWQFAVEHPLMVDIDFWCYRMTADDAIVFISKLDSLKQFQFKLVDDTEYDRLQNQLQSMDNKWQLERVSIEDASASGELTYVLKR